MKEGFVLMNLSRYKRWKALLQSDCKAAIKKKNKTHPVCLHAVEKYKKVESINIQNDYKTTSKK